MEYRETVNFTKTKIDVEKEYIVKIFSEDYSLSNQNVIVVK